MTDRYETAKQHDASGTRASSCLLYARVYGYVSAFLLSIQAALRFLLNIFI
jgi:hypothetical protein